MVCWSRLLLISHLTPQQALPLQNTFHRVLATAWRSSRPSLVAWPQQGPTTGAVWLWLKGDTITDLSKPCACSMASQPPSVTWQTSYTTPGSYLRPSMAQTDLPRSQHWWTGALKQCRCFCSWERWQIKGRVSPPLLQSNIKISLDEKSLGLLLFDCFLNEFILTSNHHPGWAELSNWKEQVTPCDQGPLHTQASLHPFHFAHSHHQLAEKPPKSWAHPFRKRGWDVLHKFKYLGTEYTEVPQNTYFSLGEEKIIIKP